MVDSLYQLFLVRLLGDEIAMLQSVGVSPKNVNPLIVLAWADGVRLG